MIAKRHTTGNGIRCANGNGSLSCCEPSFPCNCNDLRDEQWPCFINRASQMVVTGDITLGMAQNRTGNIGGAEACNPGQMVTRSFAIGDGDQTSDSSLILCGGNRSQGWQMDTPVEIMCEVNPDITMSAEIRHGAEFKWNLYTFEKLAHLTCGANWGERWGTTTASSFGVGFDLRVEWDEDKNVVTSWWRLHSGPFDLAEGTPVVSPLGGPTNCPTIFEVSASGSYSDANLSAEFTASIRAEIVDRRVCITLPGSVAREL